MPFRGHTTRMKISAVLTKQLDGSGERKITTGGEASRQSMVYQ